jgi:hypothetical protein
MAIRSLKSGIFSRSAMVGNTLIYPGSYESIASVDVGAGGSSSIDFTSIPSTYTHLQIRGLVRLSGANETRSFFCQVGNGTVATTGYSEHALEGNGSTASASGNANGTEVRIGRTATAGHSASVFGVCVIDILDYADTNKFKTIRSLDGYDNNGSGAVSFTSGNWRSTAAINTIRLFGSGENTVQYSSFALYGVN